MRAGKNSIISDTLTNIIASCQVVPEQIAFVWSDTEGSEAEVIETGQPLWLAGVPLYLEIYLYALQRQNALKSVMSLIDKFFDRCLESSEIVKQGMDALPHPISELEIPKDAPIDVLLIPRGFEYQHIKESQ